MVDYDMDTGTTGTIRIRVLTSTIEYWITSGQPLSWWESKDYDWGTPHGSGESSFGYSAGQGWKKVATKTVTISGNVWWNIEETGTSGVGNPPKQTVAVNRATVPPAPITKTPTNISDTGMTFEFDDNGTGGATITNRYYQYSKASNFSGASDISAPSNGIVTRNDLDPGTTYYWRARVRNSEGYSAYGTTRSAKTLAVPEAPTTKAPTKITHTSMEFDMDDNGNGGSAITNRYYQISTASNFSGAKDQALPSSGTVVEDDLLPGVLYYFRARVRNAVGYSAYGTTRSAKTLPGAWVKVGGVWMRAVPYVRVAGAWVPAIPHVKVAGAWTEAQ